VSCVMFSADEKAFWPVNGKNDFEDVCSNRTNSTEPGVETNDWTAGSFRSRISRARGQIDFHEYPRQHDGADVGRTSRITRYNNTSPSASDHIYYVETERYTKYLYTSIALPTRARRGRRTRSTRNLKGTLFAYFIYIYVRYVFNTPL